MHSNKDIDLRNTVHKDVNEGFARFLETKSDYDNMASGLCRFDDNKRANDLDEYNADDYFITKDEIAHIFSRLRGKLSSGIDNIPNIVLKHLPISIILEFCTLFNNMINNSHFPDSWKIAKVVVLPKKDMDTFNPKNLRPISLLPNISKVFEICVNNIILRLCLKFNIVCERQFGLNTNIPRSMQFIYSLRV